MKKKIFNFGLSLMMSLVLVVGCAAQKDKRDEKPPEKPREKIVEKPKPAPTPERKRPN